MSVRTFEEYLPPIVLACEAAGVTEAVYLHRTTTINPAILWCLENDVRLHGFETASTAPGTVWVIPNGGGGGAVDDELTGLVTWLHEEFDREPFRRSVAKLEATGRTERHLFVRLHDSGLPPELVVSMTFERIPVEPLDPPGGLTGLWLASQRKLPILWWDTRLGWRRDEYDQDTA